MFHLMLQRIMHKKWMVASILVGNILLVAIAACHPMYQAASSKRMLNDVFEGYLEENNSYPMVVETYGRIRKSAGRGDTKAVREFVQNMPESIGIPALERICFRNLVISTANSTTIHDGTFGEQKISVGALSGIENHSKILSGRMYNPGVTEDGYIEAVMSQSAMVEMNLLVGEEIEFPNIKLKGGDSLMVRVVGVFNYLDPADLFWYNSPDSYYNNLLIDPATYEKQFMYSGASKYQLNERWTVLLDYTKLEPEQIQNVITYSNDMVTAYKTVYSEIVLTPYIDLLDEYAIKQKQISVTLSILQVPVIVLLCAFIFMISRQMLEMEENEIALLKSRGASKLQVLRLYFLQSAFLALVGFVLGLPLGNVVCRVLGASSAFLTFASRRVLHVQYTAEVFIYGGLAVVVSMLMTLLPVFKRDKVSIVAVKRKRNRQSKPLWQKLYLDLILLGVSLYGLYTFSQQQDEMLVRVLSGKPLDPLIFLSSSLFILGAAMVSLRLHRLIISAMYRLGKKSWSPTAYTSFLQTIRTGNKQAFIMVFLILTVSFGLFDTTVARTIIANARNNKDYTNGADLVIQEFWKNNASLANASDDIKITYSEPDYGKYGGINGASSVTKVFVNSSTNVKSGSTTISSSLMGIETKSFGETTDVPDGLLKYDYYDYLNVLSRNSKAVLLSSNYRDQYGFKVGDSFSYNITSRYYSTTVNAVIYGFFDYWPSYSPSAVTVLPDETTYVSEKYMIVAHLSTIQEAVGVFPYQIWINMNGDTDGFYDFAEKENLRITYISDAVRAKEDISNEPLFQGTNGILTMSFITILLICLIGYVIYWTLSIRSRELLFGIFRAMGMSKREIITMIISEQMFTGLFGILFGLLIGGTASKLYVPIIQIAYSAADRVLPLELITKTSDVVELMLIIAAMFAICIAILINQVFRMKISQALKLGED